MFNQYTVKLVGKTTCLLKNYALIMYIMHKLCILCLKN